MPPKPFTWRTPTLIFTSALVPSLLVVLALLPVSLQSGWRNYWCDDRYLYDQAASMFLRGSWYADDPLELDAVRDRMPLYPTLLIGLRALNELTAIPVPAWAILINSMSLAIAACFLFFLVWNLTRRYRMALIAALLWPWLPGVTAYTLIQLPEAISTLFFLLASHALLIPSMQVLPHVPLRHFRAGILLALATLAKPVFCYFSLPALLLITLQSLQEKTGYLFRWLVFLATFLLCLTPWLYRNYSLWQTLTLTPNGSAHLANARDALAADLGLPPQPAELPRTPEAWRRLGIDPDNLPARSAYRSRISLLELHGHWPAVLRLSLWSLVKLHASPGVGTLATMASGQLALGRNDQQPAPQAANWSAFWQFLHLLFIVLLILIYFLAILGFFALWREPSSRLLLAWALLTVGYFVLISMPFGNTRYRYPAMPGYAVLAAGGIELLCVRKFRRKSA